MLHFSLYLENEKSFVALKKSEKIVGKKTGMWGGHELSRLPSAFLGRSREEWVVSPVSLAGSRKTRNWEC